MFSEKYNNIGKVYAAIDYDYIHRELSKKGVTLTLLWQEYCERAYANGEIPYMSTQFGDKYRRWARVTKATMRVTHKPGDTMQVDWAGGTIPYFDSVTGEEYKAYLFVAALPCSGYLYVEACNDMKQENWLMCHVHAYSYFGGVTRVLVPDNLKTGVTANTRYETQLNESYRELAEYYGTAIVPARVRQPQDKGLVEKSVGFSTTWITAALRERKFLSFAEVKEAVSERLEFINTKPFQKRPGNLMTSHNRLEKYSVQPVVKPEHMPANHREYLNYNAEEFKEWAKSVGKSAEEIVRHFLSSGSVPEQGYKACVSISFLSAKELSNLVIFKCFFCKFKQLFICNLFFQFHNISFPTKRRINIFYFYIKYIYLYQSRGHLLVNKLKYVVYSIHFCFSF